MYLIRLLLPPSYFGSKCEISSNANLHEVILSPIHFSEYKCLEDITDLHTRDRIGDLLTLKGSGSGAWRHIAFKYEMDQLQIKLLEDDAEAGRKTLEYLRTSNPDLTVYDFCKALKEDRVRRLNIVKELLEHLSVPNSSIEYV